MSDADKVEVEVEGNAGFEQIAQKGGGMLALFGIFEIILGMLAIIMPMAFSLAFGSLIGVLFILAGMMQLMAVRHRVSGKVNGYTIFSVLYVILGVILLVQPESATRFITLLLGIFFITGGVFRFMEALASRFSGGAKLFIFFNAFITFALGWMIVAHWPDDSEWVLGILVGVNLLLNGWTALFAGITLKNNAVDAV